jgi:hypothetical protein
MIYVDELKSGAWSARGPQAQHCRLFSDDPTPDALFAIAAQIGLDPAAWIPSRAADGTFTPNGAPFYWIRPAVRAKAVASGARRHKRKDADRLLSQITVNVSNMPMPVAD